MPAADCVPMKALVIGDIHGCWAELQALLDKAGPAAEDLILAVGDLVNRGPDSPRVLAFFRDTPNAASLRGNHEERHLEAQRNLAPLGLAHELARLQWSEEGYREACRHMATLPRARALDEALVVHAYWEPGRSLERQRPEVLTGLPGGLERLWARHERPWYELYDGELPLIVGHLDYLQTGQPFVHAERVWALDTGCCRGGRLTGLLLPDFKLVSVKAGARYWQLQREDYSELRRFDLAAHADLGWDELAALLVEIDRLENLPAGLAERRERLHRFAVRVEASLDLLLESLGRRCLGLAEELESEPDFAALPGGKRRRRYRERAGDGREGRLLTLAYKGRLGRQALREAYGSPRELLAACEELGLLLASHARPD